MRLRKRHVVLSVALVVAAAAVVYVWRFTPFVARQVGDAFTKNLLHDRGYRLDVRGVRADPFGRVVLDEPRSMIKTHDSEGAAAAARHIATLGHERIAHIRGPSTFRSSHERLRGFEEGLAEFGLTLDPKLVLEGGYTFESGVACAQQLLERPPNVRPTAVFAGNDEMAVGVYQAARRAGFGVPEDLSIVGFDDTPMASRIWPPLTTVRLPIRDMGKAAAALLVHEHGESSSLVAFTPEIIVRQSTAPLPRK